MSKFKTFILFLILFVCSSFVYASDFTVHKLQNGQTLVVSEIHNNPIVTIDTWIKTGSINENDTNNGISHFLEHLFFKGTKAHPAGEFDKILESKGAIINAATSKDFTHYYITIPSEYFNTALELHSDMLLNPQIPRKELEKERKVVLEEISKDENNPSKRVYDNLNSLMYKHHPYKRKVIGSSDIIGTVRREEILDYYNKYYTPSNMVTVIVGDVDTQNVLNKVQTYFNEPYKKQVKKLYKKETLLTEQRRIKEYMDVQSGYMMIGFRSANISDKDTFALDVLSEILGGGKISRLNKNIKEQMGLAYSISSSNFSLKDDGLFYISANFIPQNCEKLEKQIFAAIEQIKKYGITDEELQIAKNKIIQNTYFSRESTSDIASELGYIISLTDSSELYKNYVTEISKINAKDVQNAAKKYLSENRSAVSIVLPETLLNKENKPVNKCTVQKRMETNGIAKYEMSNGATILLNENKNNDIIAISIIAKGGEFIENIAGEGTLVAETLLKGTKKYSANELSQILDEYGIEIKARSDDDFFIVQVKTTKEQLDITMDVVNELLNNALFDDYELEKKRSELLSRIRQRKDIPQNVALDNFKTLIYENSVYSHTNNVLEKTLPTITKANVRSYYDKIFNPENIIISINGNVDSKDIIEKFAEILPSSGSKKFRYEDYSVTKLNSSKICSKAMKNLSTTWLFLGWQTAGIKEQSDFVTLKVVDTILGSGLSSRLYRNLRESDGLAYQLGSNYSPKMLGGIFMTYIGTNKESLDISKEKILDEINRLKVEFISDTELQSAKDRLKGGFIIAMETNTEKALNIGLFEAYGFGYDFLDKYIKMVDKVSASDIIKVANKYFNKNIVQSEVK